MNFVRFLLVVFVACGTAAAAQRASRPADEWVKVLESPDRIAALRVEEVVARLKLRPGEVVADLGAGSGPFVVPLATAVGPKGKIYAVEIDRGFFPYILQKAKEAGVTNVQVIAGAFTDPNLPAADVDVAFMHDVLHHIDNRPAYFRNLATYLKPGARVAVIDYHAAESPHRDEPALVVAKEQGTFWLADAGLRAVEDVALFEDKWFVIYRRE